MRKIKEILRLRYELGLGQRPIAASRSIGLATVADYLKRAAAAGLSWPLPAACDDRQLAAALFGSQPDPQHEPPRVPPDFADLHQQLQRHRHLTLQLAWEEYRQQHPEGHRYSY